MSASTNYMHRSLSSVILIIVQIIRKQVGLQCPQHTFGLGEGFNIHIPQFAILPSPKCSSYIITIIRYLHDVFVPLSSTVAFLKSSFHTILLNTDHLPAGLNFCQF